MASDFATAAQVDSLRGDFIAAAEKARKNRKLGILDAIRSKRVWRHWNDPLPDGDGMTVGEAMADEIALQAVAAGLVATPEAINWDEIDWEKLFAFILEFIKALMLIFGGM
jgi:hypothetical protein